MKRLLIILCMFHFQYILPTHTLLLLDHNRNETWMFDMIGYEFDKAFRSLQESPDFHIIQVRDDQTTGWIAKTLGQSCTFSSVDDGTVAVEQDNFAAAIRWVRELQDDDVTPVCVELRNYFNLF